MKLTQKVIQTRLKEIEKSYHVRILYACESGSRAWGFESQDGKSHLTQGCRLKRFPTVGS